MIMGDKSTMPDNLLECSMSTYMLRPSLTTTIRQNRKALDRPGLDQQDPRNRKASLARYGTLPLGRRDSIHILNNAFAVLYHKFRTLLLNLSSRRNVSDSPDRTKIEYCSTDRRVYGTLVEP